MSRTPSLPLTQEAALRRRCQRLLYDHRRRARADVGRLYYGLEDLMELVRKSPACDYCFAPVAFDFHLDHMVPIARGGAHALPNLCVCCAPCNVRKGVLMASEYRQMLALLATWAPAAQEDVRRRLSAGGASVYARNRRKKT